LALELGVPNPDYIAQMPFRVYRDWQAYFLLEPFGVERGELARGYAYAQLAGLWGKPKGKQGWSPEDFIPPWDEIVAKKDGVVDPDTQFKKILVLTRLYGGEVIDRRAENRKDDTGRDLASDLNR